MTMILAIIMPVPSAKASSCTALIHIGDSTTISLGKSLIRDYTANGFTNVTVSAGNGRSIPRHTSTDTMSGLEAVRYWKVRTPAGRCWVIALGTNDAASPSRPDKSERIDILSAEIGKDRALWVNVAMDSRTRPNYNGLNAFAWNTLLIEKGLTVFNWAQATQPGWFNKDGIHYNNEGNRWRSAWIAYAAAFYLK